MKKSLLLVTASFVALSFAAPAMAADFRAPAPAYTKAPVMMPVALYDWSGFYVGINGGYGESHWSDIGVHGNGGTVGAQLGYRWQASNWVFGLEAQGNWADFTKNYTNIYYDPAKASVESFGLFTGQVGYAWNNVLLYAKGGAAVVDNKYRTPYLAVNETVWGGTVGAGLEVGFAPNWSVGAEYNHIFLDRHDAFAGNQDIDMALVRLNYKFGGPSVGRY